MSHRFEFRSCIRGSIPRLSEYLKQQQRPGACLPAGTTQQEKHVPCWSERTLVGCGPRKFSCVLSLFVRRGVTITSLTGSRQYSSDLFAILFLRVSHIREIHEH